MPIKTILERSLIGGILILIGQAVATLATVWGTAQFTTVLLIQAGAVLAGTGELLRRQRQDPVQSVPPVSPPPAP